MLTEACPFCGTKLTIGRHDKFITCPTCGAELAVRSSEGNISLHKTDRFFANTAKAEPQKTAIINYKPIIAVFLLLIGLVMTGLTIKEWTDYQRLHEHGQIITGYIADRGIDFGGEFEDYYIDYAYRVNDQEYRQHIESEALYDVFARNDPVDVLYWPDDPTVAALADYHTHNTRAFSIFTAAWFVASGVYLLAVLLSHRKTEPA